MTASAASLSRPRFPISVLAAVAVWLGLAILAGATGFLARLPFPGPQLIILALLGGTLVAGTALSTLRTWLEAVPLRILIGINGLRFIGITFLVLAAQGQIAPVFANRAGWGDIATAAIAIVLAAAAGRTTPAFRAVAHAWNVFGLLDLVVAVATATWVTIQASTPGMAPVFELPLVVVPTFLVPIFLANHVFIFRRLTHAA